MHNRGSGAPAGKTDWKQLKKSISALMRYAKKYVAVILIAIVFSSISAILAVIGPDFISDLIAEISNGVKVSEMGMPFIDIDMDAVNKIGYTLVVIYAVSMILNYLQSFIMNLVASKIGNQMRRDITEKINRIPLKYFDSHNFGDTLSRVTNDVDSITQSLNMNVGTLVSSVSTLLGCIVMMLATEWRMALTAIGASLLGFILMGVIMGKSQKFFTAKQESLALVNSHVEEYFSGQNIVRAYNAEKSNLATFQENNETLRKNTFQAEFLSGMIMPLMAFIGNFGYVAVCVVGAVLAFNNVFGFEVVVAFMIYVRIFTSPLGQIGQGFAGLQSAAAAGERVMEFLGEEELPDESHKTAQLSQVEGHVSFRRVNFGYAPEKQIIHGFSQDIAAGQKVAIVGPTGAGKTTMVNLLMRFYELWDGEIAIDGVPLNQLTRENVHSLFGMVLQDTWLFEGTVRDNLAYGKSGVTDEKLYQICSQCGLKHFIDTLPHGFDTVLSDNVAVSAGQKQLLTIARAMVKDAPLLILDEATSSVDTRTELKIQRAMKELSRGRTSFVIAHRLSTIRDADLIIYMADGDIKEAGTHEELIEKNGLYAGLYNSQFVGTTA